MIRPIPLTPEQAQQLAIYRGLTGARNQQQILRDTVTRLLHEVQSKGLHLTTGAELANK